MTTDAMTADAMPTEQGPAAGGSNPVLRIRGVRKTYNEDTAPVRALRDVDFELERGEFVALMGPSGSGKSTLLHLIAGLDRPDDGSIELAGEDVVGLDEDGLARLRRRHVGIVFQFFNLLEGMTVLENVALAAMVGGAGKRPAGERARALLDVLGLLDKASALPGTLSGGQRQRLAIARALANEPTVLLADEPTGALDSVGGAEVMQLFSRLHREGQSILVVTHSRAVADAAERVVHIQDGRVVGVPGAPSAATATGAPS